MTLQRYEKKSTPPTFSTILFKAFFQTNLVEENTLSTLQTGVKS